MRGSPPRTGKLTISYASTNRRGGSAYPPAICHLKSLPIGFAPCGRIRRSAPTVGIGGGMCGSLVVGCRFAPRGRAQSSPLHSIHYFSSIHSSGREVNMKMADKSLLETATESSRDGMAARSRKNEALLKLAYYQSFMIGRGLL